MVSPTVFSLMIDQKRTGSPVVITAGNKDIRHEANVRSDLADMAAPFAKWERRDYASRTSSVDNAPGFPRSAHSSNRSGLRRIVW